MITIATCPGLDQAFLVKMALGAAGIDSFIPDENSATMAPHYFFASGVRVQVAEEDVEAARKILAEEKERGGEDDT